MKLTKTQKQRKYYKKLIKKVKTLREFKESVEKAKGTFEYPHKQDLERAEGNLAVFRHHNPEYLI